MLTSAQFLHSCQHEIRVIQHLATKVPADRLSWRPTPKQRSLLELLQYLTVCAIAPARWITDGNWDAAEAMEKEAETVTAATFAAAMDRQRAALEALVAPISEADMASKRTALPWGTPCTYGEGFVDMCLKTLVAYRMQLFLWAKESGNAALGPGDCWVGVDSKRPASAPA